MTKAQLIEALVGLGIEPPSKATNAELEALLEQAQAGVEVPVAEEPATPEVVEGSEAPEAAEEPEAEAEAEPEPEPEAEPEVEPEPEPESETVRVLIGPNGEAGRIVLRGIAIDNRTPGTITRAEYNALRTRYDLKLAPEQE